MKNSKKEAGPKDVSTGVTVYATQPARGKRGETGWGRDFHSRDVEGERTTFSHGDGCGLSSCSGPSQLKKKTRGMKREFPPARRVIPSIGSKKKKGKRGVGK